MMYHIIAEQVSFIGTCNIILSLPLLYQNKSLSYAMLMSELDMSTASSLEDLIVEAVYLVCKHVLHYFVFLSSPCHIEVILQT
jgi:hypothetical protein